MGGMKNKAIIIIMFTFLQISSFCSSFPLSTSNRWIVDSTGKRVKLACVNWVSHLPPMLAEGLDKKPLNFIVSQIVANGFNCVRFTWATFMFTRPDYYNLTVSQSLDKYNLVDAKTGISQNNPQFLNMNIMELHQAVVNEFGKNNLMVVLDNHVSEPNWCCSDGDGNGFFGDPSFDPTEWLKGLIAVARTYKGNSAVVGMSLRNELRGNRQNEDDWYNYMREGANLIHNENPDVLVIISGLSYDTNLGFLRNRRLEVNLDNKLVYEAHCYAWSIYGHEYWTTQSNIICATLTQIARENYLFLTEGPNPFPLFLSEFGIDQRGSNEGDNRYISCLLAEMASLDVDWALWSFHGSYMLREGTVNMEETFGVMDLNWDRPRNPGFLNRLQFIRQMNQVSNASNPTSFIIFHPQSGQCVQIGGTNAILADCKTASRWDHGQDRSPINLAGNPQLCLTMAGDGAATTVSNDCSSHWTFVSRSTLQLGAPNAQGYHFCLQKNESDNTVVTKKCLCVGDDLVDFPLCGYDPLPQWFKFVPINAY